MAEDNISFSSISEISDVPWEISSTKIIPQNATNGKKLATKPAIVAFFAVFSLKKIATRRNTNT